MITNFSELARIYCYLSTMLKRKITILGAGNMGSAIARSLAATDFISRERLTAADNNSEKLEKIRGLKIKITLDALAACENSDIIFLAVKPQDFFVLAEKIKPAIKKQLIISIMAGLSLETMSQKLQTKNIIRAMPNLAAQVGESMTVWAADKSVFAKEKALTKLLLQSFGVEIETDKEALLDSVTAICGSGPAYFYYFIEQWLKSAVALGLADKEAELLIKQTIFGSLRYWHKSGLPPAELKKMVVSRGGTTEACLKYWEKKQVDRLLREGIKRARKRAQELNF